MAIVTREDMVSFIPNTTMQKGYINGVHTGYFITPVDGYALHDKASDYEDPDTGIINDSFYAGVCSCGKEYDFSTVPAFYTDAGGSVVNVVAFGEERAFYAVPADRVYRKEREESCTQHQKLSN